MSLLTRIIKHQEATSVVHNDKLLPAKLALLLLSYFSIILASIDIFVIVILTSITLLILGRGCKIVLESITLYTPIASMIILVNYLFATMTVKTIIILVYGYTVFITMIMFISTTPRKQFLHLLEKLRLDMVFFLVFNIVEELNEMLDSKKARGWEPGFNILKYYVPVVDAIKLSIIRLVGIEEALLARGVEKD